MKSEATESQLAIDLESWFETNKKKVYTGVGVALAVVFVLYLNSHFQAAKQAKANAALLALNAPVVANAERPAVKAEAFAKVATEHPGTKAGAQAALLAASAYYGEGKFAEAERAFTQFQSTYSDSPLLSAAVFGQASALEAQNKTAEAVTAYQGVLTRFAQSADASLARLALGRLHEAQNKPADALKLYDELIGNGMFSSFGQEAAQRRARLLAAHLELDKPAVAPSFAPATTNVVVPAQ
jgi:TolA-binding protein